MKHYKAYDIKWDTDGENVNLPSEVTIEMDDDADVSLEGADVLSDKYGWCVSRFSFEEIA